MTNRRATRLVLRVLYGIVAIAITSFVATSVRSNTHLPAITTTTSTTLGPTTTTLSPWTTTSTTIGSTPRFTGNATPSTLAPLASGDLDGFTVAIDPGHNGGNVAHPEIINQLVPDGRGQKSCDTTGTATDNGFPESTFTFAMANAVAERLRLRGAIVILTRSDNSSVGPCVNIRAALGNGADVAISLHGDGGTPTGHGFTILTPTGVGPSRSMTQEANRFAGILRHHLLAAGVRESNYLGVNGIQPRSDLAGLNLSTTPKVFLECANMKNSEDASYMQSAPWRDHLATSVSDAVAVFLKSLP